MGFRYHHIRLVLGLVLLLICAISLGWALSTSKFHLSILLGTGILIAGVYLYSVLTRANREILFFFRALENDDTTITYHAGNQSKFIDELHRHLDRINSNFQELRLKNEEREQYFSRILEHLSSGLIIMDERGHIDQVNEEALRLLNMPRLTHIRALSRSYPGLQKRVKNMKSLDRSEIALTDKETGLKRTLGLQMVIIHLRGEDIRVLTLHDLSSGMERKEIDDWIRLIRVMSHEIMNSLAPITSISTTLGELWSEQTAAKNEGVTEKTIQQTIKGLDAIAEQSEGLTAFFESYRVLSRIPDPVKKEISVQALFEKLETLVEYYREDHRLSITFASSEPELKIYADEQMVKQVLLNLIKNAADALENKKAGEIQITGESTEEQIVLKVTDNGEGIPAELSDEIFMPFFTTRKKGTGVGLSYCRQVMAMHDGRIEFISQPGKTLFRLVF